jgi:hypothetical protein
MCNKALPIITRDSWHNALSNEKSSSSPLLYVNHPNTSLLNPEQAYPQNSQNPRMMFPNPPVTGLRCGACVCPRIPFSLDKTHLISTCWFSLPDSYSKCSWPQFFHSKSFSLAYLLALVVPANGHYQARFAEGRSKPAARRPKGGFSRLHQLISPTLPPKKNPELPPAIAKSWSNLVGCLICH